MRLALNKIMGVQEDKLFALFKRFARSMYDKSMYSETHDCLNECSTTDEFISKLSDMDSDTLRTHRKISGSSQSLRQKLTSIWKRRYNRLSNVKPDISDTVLAYFADMVSIKSLKISNDDTKHAYSLLNQHYGVKSMMFIHAQPLSSNTTASLCNQTNRPIMYKIDVISDSILTINASKHSLVPKHTKVNKDQVLSDMIDESELPFIHIKDPAIEHMNVNPGDIIEVRREIRGEVYIYYRIVNTVPHV